MFIVVFLGLTFLIASVAFFTLNKCEKPSFLILRKVEYNHPELLQGIQLKQLSTFAIPLFLGLCHSYFAAKPGWFLFGSDIWTPMLPVMGLYTAFYSIFGILFISYYKKIIKESL